MIDLHIHTKYSDGDSEVKDILKKANELNLEVISITDHNNIDAYKEIKNIDVKKIYKGKIIVGCEITVAYKGAIIEIIGYDLDFQKIEYDLNRFFSDKIEEENEKKIYIKILDRLDELNIRYKDNLRSDINNIPKHYCEKIYDNIIDKIILNNEGIVGGSTFYRKGITNVDSKFYIDLSLYKPSIKEGIDIIHKAGGKVFLAHPFRYKYNDIIKFLKEIINDNLLDGIECYHSSFNEEQINYLIKICKDNNLLISGGSDYHGNKKLGVKLGIGKDNLNIHKSILNDWSINNE